MDHVDSAKRLLDIYQELKEVIEKEGDLRKALAPLVEARNRLTEESIRILATLNGSGSHLDSPALNPSPEDVTEKVSRKTSRSKKTKFGAGVKNTDTMTAWQLEVYHREICDFFLQNGWRKTLSHYALNPKQASRIIERVKGRCPEEEEKSQLSLSEGVNKESATQIRYRKILNFMGSRPSIIIKIGDLAKSIDEPANYVSIAMRHLCSEGLIEKVSHGRYCFEDKKKDKIEHEHKVQSSPLDKPSLSEMESESPRLSGSIIYL